MGDVIVQPAAAGVDEAHHRLDALRVGLGVEREAKEMRGDIALLRRAVAGFQVIDEVGGVAGLAVGLAGRMIVRSKASASTG